MGKKSKINTYDNLAALEVFVHALVNFVLQIMFPANSGLSGHRLLGLLAKHVLVVNVLNVRRGILQIYKIITSSGLMARKVLFYRGFRHQFRGSFVVLQAVCSRLFFVVKRPQASGSSVNPLSTLH